MRIIVICIDGSSCANYAFRWAAENYLRSDDHLILLHACKDFKKLDTENTKKESKEKEWSPEQIHEYQERVEEQARLLTAQYTGHLVGQNIVHEAALVRGDPKTTIVEYVEKIKPGCIIMGTRGLGAMQRAIKGSVSDHVLHSVSCPVIIVKEGEKI